VNTVVNVMIALVIILIAVTAVYSVTDSAVDSADDEVERSNNLLLTCLSEGASSEDCSLFDRDVDGGG